MDLTLPALSPAACWSVCVTDAATGAVLASATPERLQRTASVGKVFLLLEVAHLIGTGQLDAAEPLTRTDADDVADSGLWQRLATPTLPVADLAVLVGAVSDNLATNVLLRRVGIDAVRARARAEGCAESALLDRVRDERLPGMPPTLSLGRADELAALMGRLHRGEAVDAAASTLVRGWLAGNADLSMVAGAFDLDPLAHGEPDRGVTLINKTGTISTVRADVGIVATDARALAYAVLAEWDADVDARDAVLADMDAVGVALRRWSAT